MSLYDNTNILRDILDEVNALPDSGGGSGNEEYETIIKQMIDRDTLIEIVIPSEVTYIGHSAFRGCTNLERVVFNQTEKILAHSAFALCYKLSFSELPNSLETIGESAFQSAAFTNKLLKLPNSLKTIGNTAFQYCKDVAIKEIPQSVVSIGKQAFQQCSKITELTFKGIPTTIQSNSFQTCNNLTVINVPWSEGAVANAPWGATNATINYNYTGE